jgi:excisionase family DNA binding protein
MMLTLKDVSDELSVSRDLVLSMIRAGQIPEARKYGGIWRFPVEALERLKANRPPPAVEKDGRVCCPGCGMEYDAGRTA